MTTSTKAILRELLIFALIGLIGAVFFIFCFGVLYLLGSGFFPFMNSNAAVIPFLRYVTNSVLISSMLWWFFGIIILIALRFPVAGVVITVLSAISGVITAIPEYLILSKLVWADLFLSVFWEPLSGGLLVLSAIFLFRLGRNRALSYFLPLGVVLLINSVISVIDNTQMRLSIAAVTTVIMWLMGMAPYFLERGLQRLIPYQSFGGHDVSINNQGK